ncbi:hypothetical protein MKW94_011621 [Papaver nudicaule]|uniref:Uncharacterized protein n=1 Tax=Papaver nudicaule TaxID=74823 RepID=A0AA41RPQ3_PAPNU|nr:hypothetical protein [Papaver nudicaule]
MGESFTIQISSNLVSQLTETGDKSKKKTRKPKPKTSTKVPKKPTIDNFEEHKGSSADSGWPLQAPLPPPALFLPITPQEVPPQIPNAELDAIRSTLKESEKVVERLQKQEENMLQEVTKKAKDLHDKEFKLPYQNPFLCLIEKEACLECYKENSKNPLKCGEVVTRFKNCVRISVQQASSAQ